LASERTLESKSGNVVGTGMVAAKTSEREEKGKQGSLKHTGDKKSALSSKCKGTSRRHFLKKDV
jgi:hypothetical protein